MILVSTIALASALAQPTPGPISPPRPPMPAIAVPPPRAPAVASPAAKALAEAVIDGLGLLTPERMQADIVRGLVGWRPNTTPCDFSNTECSRTARELAEREAPAFAAAIRDAIARNLGAHFDRSMSPDQIAESARFFAAPAGRALVRSVPELQRLGEPALWEVSGIHTARLNALRPEFDRRTAPLPRRLNPQPVVTVPVPPPTVRVPSVRVPPPPPPPPRN